MLLGAQSLVFPFYSSLRMLTYRAFGKFRANDGTRTHEWRNHNPLP